MTSPTTPAGSNARADALRPARFGARASRGLAGVLAGLALAGAFAAPAAATSEIKPDPDKAPGYQDLRNPDTRDFAEGRYPAQADGAEDGLDWSQVALGAGGAGALIIAAGGLSRRRRAAGRSSGATA